MNNKRIYAIVLFLGFIGSVLGQARIVRAEQLTLSENGETSYTIFVAKKTSESEKYAAAELANFLNQVTGAKFRITSKLSTGVDKIIAVGPDAARQVLPSIQLDGLGAEGILILNSGENLIITGGQDAVRGTLYAVYTFLEDYVGCRWWSSQVSTIPRKSTLTINIPLNTRYVSPLEYRDTFWFDAFDADWAVRNKIAGHAGRQNSKQGGISIFAGYVHTFNMLIPPKKYFKKHPEWFSEIKGKRTAEYSQLCLTNEEMRQELVKNLKILLRETPGVAVASVSQNDWLDNCQCSKCVAIDREEGSPSGPMLRFVNAVASDIEEEFPNVAISTLAYTYTQMPPKYVKPRHNVIVQLCSVECSFSKPLSDECNRKFRDDIVSWSNICNRLYIWDYTTNFGNYLMPHPNLRVLAPNIRFFVAHNVKGVFEQGAFTTQGAEMAELRTWVLAKLLWNPNLDDQELIKEFLNGYYGPAGKHIGTYLNVMHNAIEVTGEKLSLAAPIDANFLSFDTLNEGWQCLQAAEESVKDNPDLLFRVRVAKLPVMYVFMMRWNEMRSQAKAAGIAWPMPESIDDAYNHFVVIARAKDLVYLNETYDKGYHRLEKAISIAKQQDSGVIQK